MSPYVFGRKPTIRTSSGYKSGPGVEKVNRWFVTSSFDYKTLPHDTLSVTVCMNKYIREEKLRSRGSSRIEWVPVY